MNLAPKFIKIKRLPIDNCIILEDSASLRQQSQLSPDRRSPSDSCETTEQMVIEESIVDDEPQSFQWIKIEPQTFERQTKKPHTHFNHDCTKTKEQIRRQTHNEIERRRRDKINTWINKLSGLLPQNMEIFERTSTTACDPNSKGGILVKACEYISQLKSTVRLLGHENRQLKEKCKRLEILLAECNAAKTVDGSGSGCGSNSTLDRSGVIQVRNNSCT